jgi:N-acetylmuramoyl-L-alanine amidase
MSARRALYILIVSRGFADVSGMRIASTIATLRQRSPRRFLISIKGAAAGEVCHLPTTFMVETVLTENIDRVPTPHCLSGFCVGTRRTGRVFMNFCWTAAYNLGHNAIMLTGLTFALSIFAAQPAIAEGVSGADMSGRRMVLHFDSSVAVKDDPAPLADNPAIVPVIDFARPPRKMHSVTVPIPPVAKGVRLPRIYGPADASRPLVVIDAGHGGHDPGAVNAAAGKREKDVTLGIALAVRDALVASGRVRVALTREDDRFLVLQERYGIARRMSADLFISIHADAAENDEARGATIYTLSETASDREAARLAARENKADIINGVNLGGQSGDVSSILIDLTQRETMNLSANFAQLLQREAAPYVAFRSGYHRFASLMVLKAPDMPSVLFETGYISNMEDVAKLGSRDGQRQIATGIARAIDVHFARRLAQR